jgi:hypothetical protein
VIDPPDITFVGTGIESAPPRGDGDMLKANRGDADLRQRRGFFCAVSGRLLSRTSQNPKSETRNPKQIRNPNVPNAFVLYDVALRDFGLSLGALALARLSRQFNARPPGV